MISLLWPVWGRLWILAFSKVINHSLLVHLRGSEKSCNTDLSTSGKSAPSYLTPVLSVGRPAWLAGFCKERMGRKHGSSLTQHRPAVSLGTGLLVMPGPALTGVASVPSGQRDHLGDQEGIRGKSEHPAMDG